MAISTEPQLLIDDLNQSPFNVGLKIQLEDFDAAQVRELNQRYQSPLDDRHILALIDLLNGHPYLTSRALYTMLTEEMTWDRLVRAASADNGPFGDHLRRYLWILSDRPQLRDALRQITRYGQCPDERSFHRLLQAGLIKGLDRQSCTYRCKLYEIYLKDKL
jgi:hypothetical protein